MAINTQTIRIDLNTGKNMPVAYTHQNDTDRQLTFTLYNNGVAYTPSGTTAKFAFKTPIVNGEYSVITGSQMATGTIAANTVTVTLPATYTAISGVGLLTMLLTTSGNTLRPVNIKLVVQSSVDGDDTVMGASDFPESLFEYMDDWMAENEPTEIANLKSDLYASVGNLEKFTPNAYIKTNLSAGSVVDLTQLEGTSEFSYVIAECESGENFVVSAIGGSSSIVYAWVDESNKLISRGYGGQTLDDEVLVAPPKAKKLIVNNVDSSYTHYVIRGGNLVGTIDNRIDSVSNGVLDVGAEDLVTGTILPFAYSTDYDTSDEMVVAKSISLGDPFETTASGNVMSARTKFVDANGIFTLAVRCNGDAGTQFDFHARLQKSDNTFAWKHIQTIPLGEDTVVTVDLANLAVYNDAVKVAFIIASYSDASAHRNITLLKHSSVSKYGSLATYGHTLGEWLQNLNNRSINSNTDGNRQASFSVAPNGSKYVKQITDTLEEVYIPVIPTKSLFIGNSLLIGFNEFGMCASDNTKDYFSLFNAYIHNINSSSTSSKISGVDWESASTLSAKNTWVTNNITASLLNGVDLICVQLGDNVSGLQSDILFDACSFFIKKLRSFAPWARVCWIGSWYAQELMESVRQACDACGATFIDIRQLVSAQNKGHYGQVVCWGSSRMFQYSDITYVDNGDDSVTITFTAEGTQYSATIPFSNITTDGNKVNIWSDYYVVTKAGVAGHPGDRGFRAIANKILYDLFITDVSEQYELS